MSEIVFITYCNVNYFIVEVKVVESVRFRFATERVNVLIL